MSTSTRSAPRSFRTLAPTRQAALAAVSPKIFWSAGRGMPITACGGAGRIGAEAEGEEAEGHGNRRTGARSAGHNCRIEGVPRHRIGRAHANEPGRKLVEVGFADDDGAGSHETRNRGRSRLRGVGEG